MQAGGGGGSTASANGLSVHGYGLTDGSSNEDLPSLYADASSSTPQQNHHASAAASASLSSSHTLPHSSSSSSLTKVQPPPPHLVDIDNSAAYPLSAYAPASLVPSSIDSNGLSSSAAAVLPACYSNASTSIIPSASSSPFLSHAGSSDVDDVIFPA